MIACRFPMQALAVLATWCLIAAVAAASDPSALRVMPVGDSITAGYTDNPTWNVPFAFGYRSGLYTRLVNAAVPVQFVGASLEPWSGVFGVPQTVSAPDLRTVGQDLHRGYGGQGVNYVAGNVAGWLGADDPNVVLLMVGINDIARGASGASTTAQAGLDNVVRTIVTTKPDANLIVAQITPYASYTDSIVQYNNYIKNTLVPTYAALGKRVTTVDQYANFLGTDGAIDASLYSNAINHPNAASYDKMAQTWFDGIQSLDTLTPARPALVNGTFEFPAFAANSHNVNPAGTDWTFSSGEAGAGSGIDRGNPYGAAIAPNCSPAEGAQMAFLQGAGSGTTSLQQTLSGLCPGKRYAVRFQAKAIQGFAGANPFGVSVDGEPLAFDGNASITAAATGYSVYTSSPFTPRGSTAVLDYHDAGNVPVGCVSWIDNVELAVVTPAEANLVKDGSFESTVFAAASHNVNPGVSAWRFSAGAAGSGSGIDRGNPYGAASALNCSPFDGEQMAFLQGAGAENGVSSIEQDVAGFEVGRQYVISLEAKAIQGFDGVNPFHASIDGVDLRFGGGRLISPATGNCLYISDLFTADHALMTLRFYDAGGVPVTHVTWIDDVQITPIPEPGAATLLGIGGAFVLTAAMRRRTSSWRGSEAIPPRSIRTSPSSVFSRESVP